MATKTATTDVPDQDPRPTHRANRATDCPQLRALIVQHRTPPSISKSMSTPETAPSRYQAGPAPQPSRSFTRHVVRHLWTRLPEFVSMRKAFRTAELPPLPCGSPRHHELLWRISESRPPSCTQTILALDSQLDWPLAFTITCSG